MQSNCTICRLTIHIFQQLQDAYTVTVIFCLPVFTSLNYLYGPCPIKISSSIAIYPLLQEVVILITINTSESFYHVQQTKSSELALFCELDENYEDIYFLQTHTYLSMKLFILENK